MRDLFEHISKTLETARNKGIEANTIVIDTGIAISNGFPLSIGNRIELFPPMVFGLKVRYSGKPLPNNAAFVLTKTDGETIGEKKLRIFDTIIRKKVNVLEVATCADYETYLSFFKMYNWHHEYDDFILTENEFLEIKEYLGN